MSSPKEHFDRAEELLDLAEQAAADVDPDRCHVLAHLAEVHALLAQIGTPLSWQGRPATMGRPL